MLEKWDEVLGLEIAGMHEKIVILPKEVEQEKLDEVLKAAMFSPTAHNRRSWEFVVVKDKGIIEKTLQSIVNKEFSAGLTIENASGSKGCEKCNLTGYKGRTGIYEAILTDESIEMIVKENPSEREINKAAENQNILNMKQDGIIKVLQGVTSLDELGRVIDLEE